MLTPGVLWTLFAIAYRVATWPPAECPATTIFVRFGNVFLSASLRTISSMKSNDESVGCDGDMPPARQLTLPFGHTTSLASGLSGDAIRRGDRMIVLSRAPARNPAAVAVSK